MMNCGRCGEEVDPKDHSPCPRCGLQWANQRVPGRPRWRLPDNLVTIALVVAALIGFVLGLVVNTAKK